MKKTKIAATLALTLGLAAQSQAATYRLVELAGAEVAPNSFPADMNDAGTAVSTMQFPYNPPIDLSFLDFDDETFAANFTDVDSAREGNFNADDLLLIETAIKAQQNTLLGQRLADFNGYVGDETSVQLVPGFDEIDDSLGRYTQGPETRLIAINNQGMVAGAGGDVYRRLDFTNSNDNDFTYIINDFGLRGFVEVNGTTVALEPVETGIGGISEAMDINDNLMVAGYESTEQRSVLESSIANCNDDDVRGDVPVEVCLQNLRSTVINAGFVGSIPQGYVQGFQIRGAVWQLDNAGNIVSKQSYGIIAEPDEDDTRQYVSRALSVNNAGIAVGEASLYFQGDTAIIRTFPVIFQGDEIVEFVSQDEYLTGTAIKINNSNLVAGQATRNINGFNRTKFFVHDINSNETRFPSDFFPGSSSVVRDINDNGMVVGNGELEATLNAPRRSAGFLYDNNQDTFSNINEFLDCDTSYSIVDANAINDDNEILATAVINRQVLDRTGEPAVDADGNAITGDVVVSVKLIPIPGGTIDDCEQRQNQNVQERSGGSIAWGLLAGLVLPFRRKRRLS